MIKSFTAFGELGFQIICSHSSAQLFFFILHNPFTNNNHLSLHKQKVRYIFMQRRLVECRLAYNLLMNDEIMVHVVLATAGMKVMLML